MDRHDPSLPYLEQYRMDLEQFKGLFSVLFSWASGTHTDGLAVRFFRLLDQNADALINFREFINGLGECVCVSLFLPLSLSLSLIFFLVYIYSLYSNTVYIIVSSTSCVLMQSVLLTSLSDSLYNV